jgi:hypothetical protein
VVLKGKFIVINTYLKKKRTISDKQPTLTLQRSVESKFQVNRRKKITKVRTEINKVETRKNTKD